MLSSDLALGVVMLAIASVYYLLGTTIPQSALDDAVGPRGLPRIYAVALAVLAVATIVRGAVARRRRVERPVMATRGRHVRSWRFAGMILIGILYLAVVPWLGYLVSIALLMAATAWYQGGSIGGRVLLVASSAAVFLWLLFVAVLGIPQPSGVWSAIF